MNSELGCPSWLLIGPLETFPVALPSAMSGFCSINVAPVPISVGYSPRFVAPTGQGVQGKRDHRTDA